MATLLLLSQFLLLPLFPAKAMAETRVTITIAGGVACGFFFLLQFGFRSSLLHHQKDSTALLNGGPEGWEMSYPSINIRQDQGSKMAYPESSRETVQMELLKLRF